MHSFYIENLGCAKNQVDAELMGAALEDAGWQWIDDPARAQLILVNTCSFIEPAQEESVNTTLDILSEYPDAQTVMTGCLSQRFADAIADEMPELSGVFGNRDPSRIVDLVSMIAPTGGRPSAGERSGAPVILLPEGGAGLDSNTRRRLLSHPGSAFVKIAEGCDHRCSFCAIPDIRGPLRTRTVSGIVEEIRRLSERGIFEFNLVAQDLAAYDRPDLKRLLSEILELPGDFWIRPLYVYPDEFPLDLVRLSLEDARLLPYYDIPFQHASGEILRRMSRHGDANVYRKLIDEIRSINPAAVIRSSFIAGFPGEDEAHVSELMHFLEAATIEWAGFFRYSPQEGTPAMAWVERGGLPDDNAVSRRIDAMQLLQQDITTRRLERFVGTEQRVLIEEAVQGSAMYLARAGMQAPEVDGLVIVHADEASDAHGAALAPGDVVRVRIRNVRGIDMNADLIQSV